MPTLVIAEKPSVARDLANVLGAREKGTGSLSGNGYVITWAAGHLLQLQEPGDYNPRYKLWRLTDLPIIPEQFALKPQPRHTQLTAISRLLKRDDIDVVVNACDAGREGELIFRWIMEWCGSKLPAKRLWLSSLTRSAIQEAIDSLRPSSEFDLLGEAARLRAQSDWLVGMNATRALTKKCGTLLSVGRVQTPTLYLIVCREQAIDSFVKTVFYTVHVSLKHGKEKFPALYDPERISTLEEADAIKKRLLSAGKGTVKSVEQKELKRFPPPLYDLTDLQRDMNVRYGYSAHKTLTIAQELYERHKAITYPRTDSKHISAKTIPLAARALSQLEARWPEKVARLRELSDGKVPYGKLVKESDVRDHHAIMPTGTAPDVSGELQKVYDAVCERLLAVLYPVNIRRETEVLVLVGDDTLKARGIHTIAAGWREVVPGPEDNCLPELFVGDSVDVVSADTKEGETSPPERYTDATLLRAMQTAGQETDDEAVREAMKDKGLGTPATRAATIERLIDVGYVERQKRALVPTEKGKGLIRVIPVKELLSPELTGDWEKRLSLVEAGQIAPSEFANQMQAFVRQIAAQMTGMAAERISDVAGSCPRCGHPVELRGQAFKCQSCSFYLPATIAGRKMTRDNVAVLLEKKRTPLLYGFHSKAGRKFKAHLVLSDDMTVKFEFAKPKRKNTKKTTATGQLDPRKPSGG